MVVKLEPDILRQLPTTSLTPLSTCLKSTSVVSVSAMWESFSTITSHEKLTLTITSCEKKLSLLCPFLHCSNLHLPTVSRKLCTRYSVASGTSLHVTGILAGSTRSTVKKASGQNLFIGRSEKKTLESIAHHCFDQFNILGICTL